MNFPGTIRVRVTTHDLPPALQVSLASCVDVKRNAAKTVDFLNRQAKTRGVNATYELATEEEYWAYRKQLADAKAAQDLAAMQGNMTFTRKEA